MITIPTAELVGILCDAIPFISADKDDVERRVVELRWDGSMLHASALDGFRAVVSSWHPDDDPCRPVEYPLGTDLGGDDKPWDVLLEADDVKHLIDTAKTGSYAFGRPTSTRYTEARRSHRSTP